MGKFTKYEPGKMLRTYRRYTQDDPVEKDATSFTQTWLRILTWIGCMECCRQTYSGPLSNERLVAAVDKKIEEWERWCSYQIFGRLMGGKYQKLF